MKIIDGIPFECKQCGECCRWSGYVYLTEADIKRLESKLGNSDNYVKTVHDGRDKVLINKQDSKDCVFLKDNKCEIFDIKPEQCNDFPVAYQPQCPGFSKTKKEANMNRAAQKVTELYQKIASGDTTEDFDKAVSKNLYNDLTQGIKVASVTAQAIEGGVSMFFDQNRIKIASLDDLFAFNRVDDKHIIHKSTKDLWSIESDDKGEVHITRLFESGKPVKGC